MWIPYHVPAGNGETTLSISAVAQSPDTINEFRSRYSDGVTVQEHPYRFTDTENEEQVRVFYTGMDVRPVYLPTSRSFDDPVMKVAIRAHRGIWSTVESHTRNKEFEADQLRKAFTDINWMEDVSEVAAALLSSLLRTHAFPNANHRTSLAIISEYLSLYTDSVFRVSDIVGERPALVDEFIQDSKRLLTLRRNQGVFRYLFDYGCSGVIRKGGIEVPIEPATEGRDFDTEHRNRCHEFIVDALRIADEEVVTEQIDDGLHNVRGQLENPVFDPESEGRRLAGLRD